jgi:leucyl/phenylalanyl-tRNA--protein transferase
MVDDGQPITPDLLLRAYAAGIFPMAESADDPGLFWLEPKQRGVIPLDSFVVPRRLARTVRSDMFTVTVDQDFDAVIDACAASAEDRPTTWINQRIRVLYGALFHRGHCHTVEVRDETGALVGGLYGVRLGGAFFGESMFHRARDASKVALVHLVARLKAGGFTLLDTQFVTPHLAQFGAVELPRAAYRRRLEAALVVPARWDALPLDEAVTGTTALGVIEGR